MKKLILVIALLVGGISSFVPQMSATQENPEVCVPGAPCAYQGKAVAGPNDVLHIQVYIVGGQYVARFKASNGKVYEAYAIKCGPCKYYINYDSRKYYFEM